MTKILFVYSFRTDRISSIRFWRILLFEWLNIMPCCELSRMRELEKKLVWCFQWDSNSYHPALLSKTLNRTIRIAFDSPILDQSPGMQAHLVDAYKLSRNLDLVFPADYLQLPCTNQLCSHEIQLEASRFTSINRKNVILFPW